MIKRFSVFLLVIFSYLCFAHTPNVRLETYGNVKFLFHSNFHYNKKMIEAEDLKVDIIGKLSKKIAEKYQYKDTIMIERIVSKENDSLFILENKNSNLRLFGLKYNFKTNNSGIAIRILTNKAKVEDVLKLVEYAIKNRSKLNRSLKKVDFKRKGRDTVLTFRATPNDLIKKIRSKKSEFVEQLMKNRIELFDNGDHATGLFWQNNKFHFIKSEYNDPKYVRFGYENFLIEDFLYYIDSESSSYFLIFLNKQRFKHFDGYLESTVTTLVLPNPKIYEYHVVGELSNRIFLQSDQNDLHCYNSNKKTLQKID